MIVAIGGMQRSGSTFSFNIVREMLEEQGSVIAISDNSLTISAAEEFAQGQISIIRDQLSTFVDIDGNYKLQNCSERK